MSLSASEFITLRETAKALLEELDLDTYLFEVEQKQDHCELKVECACSTDGEWTTVTLSAPTEAMLTGFTDQEMKNKFLEYWIKKLALCKKKGD